MSTVGVAAVGALVTFAREHGLLFYDAPVQGSRPAAENGQLVILASGPDEGRSLVQPVYDAIGKAPHKVSAKSDSKWSAAR